MQPQNNRPPAPGGGRNPAAAAALLLVGPTGAGKTPLGEALEARGLAGKRCLHFDFGANLRRAAISPTLPPGLSEADRNVIRNVLQSGALLSDEQFPIARAVLESFLSERAPGPGSLLVLNGLPRHVGQARALEPIVRIERIVHLVCPPEVVLARIRRDAGGDRSVRTDDDEAAVRRRIRRFHENAGPLLEFHRARGVPILRLPVGASDTGEDLRRRLESRRPAAKRADP